MLSLRELKRASAILSANLASLTLRRVAQTEEQGLALAFSRPGLERILFLACRPELARVSLLEQLPVAPAAPLSFQQFLKAHLLKSSFAGVEVAGDDRTLALFLESSSGRFSLILSILGPRSNIYLVDPQGRLVHALRPLDETRRELELGGPWKKAEGAIRSEGEDRWEAVEDDAWFAEVERAYVTLERRREFETLARRIETVLGREEAFLGRKAANLQEDLAGARQGAVLRRQGELLKAALHRVRAGDGQLLATDFETGEEVVIPLDPALSPAQNLEALFARYQKDVRGVAVIQEQSASLEEEREALRRLRERLEELRRSDPDMEALRELAGRPRLRRLLARHYAKRRPAPQAPKAPARKALPSKLLPRRFLTGDGLEVWVGRSDEGNDYMTTRLARGNDLFFHLEGYPGSHVILRTEGRPDPPPESMLAACELAVHFSKLKASGHADVHVASIKDVRKPKGAKPGLVYVRRGRSIRLRRDPKRLESILASRLDF